jgi:peptidoglycan/xylan/chitin deacetylase (PgdA/CDA1 family)
LNLKTAVTKNISHWDCILGQVGLPFTEIDWKKNIFDEYAVIVINSLLKEEQIKQILNYAERGGSLLAEAQFFNDVVKTKKVHIKYLYSRGSIFGNYLPVIDLYRTCQIAVNSNLLNNQDGLNIVSSFNHGAGNVIVIPGDFISGIFDTKIMRKNFYSSLKKYPSERVSKISKGSIYHFIKTSLEYLYHKRDLPFISLWNFPGNSKNIFAFRIDTDYGSQEEINYLYQTVKENSIKGTWFVETKSAESWIEKFSSFENQEIGLHCYRHRVFNSYKKNYVNFGKGIKVLNKASISPKGIAAPFGEWNKSFNKSAEDLGFEYSSEFSYSYDSLPHFTAVEGKLQNILQIPIHPISFGRLFQARYNDEEMYNYLIKIIQNKIALSEPVIIYTHPQEKRYEILKRIFNFVNEMNLLKCTFYEYSTWWKRRSKIKYSASFVDNEVKIENEIKDENFWFRIIYPSKESYLIPSSGNPAKIKVGLPEFEYNKDFQPDVLRTYTNRMLKDNILFEVRKRKL